MGPVEYASVVNDVVSTLAILGGAGWAYFKFLRGRSLCPNLSLSLIATQHQIDHDESICVAVRIENSGTIALQFPLTAQQDLRIRRIRASDWDPTASVYRPPDPPHRPMPPLKVMMIDGVLDADLYMEPGEVFDNQILLRVEPGWEALELLLTVETQRRTIWSRMAEKLGVEHRGEILTFTMCKVVTRTDGGSKSAGTRI